MMIEWTMTSVPMKMWWGNLRNKQKWNLDNGDLEWKFPQCHAPPGGAKAWSVEFIIWRTVWFISPVSEKQWHSTGSVPCQRSLQEQTWHDMSPKLFLAEHTDLKMDDIKRTRQRHQQSICTSSHNLFNEPCLMTIPGRLTKLKKEERRGRWKKYFKNTLS